MKKEVSIFFICCNVEVFSVPANNKPWQFASLTWIVLIKRSFDTPIVRECELTPAAIVVIAFCVGDVLTYVLSRTNSLDAISNKLITGRPHPVFYFVVAE